MKDYFETVFKTNLEQVRNNCDIASDSDSDESLYDE